jgi:predicted amidohydrolase
MGTFFFYDKRHLFRMGDEPMYYNSGNERLIVNYLGWNICLQICYDMRFPVWSRNKRNEYDLLIYVANWPEARAKVWDVLLKARAIENMSYVTGVNRVGLDGLGLNYMGDSMVVNARGDELLRLHSGVEDINTITLSLAQLCHFRDKFPTWKDADNFSINS